MLFLKQTSVCTLRDNANSYLVPRWFSSLLTRAKHTRGKIHYDLISDWLLQPAISQALVASLLSFKFASIFSPKNPRIRN